MTASDSERLTRVEMAVASIPQLMELGQETRDMVMDLKTRFECDLPPGLAPACVEHKGLMDGHAARLTAHGKQIDDHETRLKVQEDSRNKQLGALAVASLLAGLASGLICVGVGYLLTRIPH